MNFRPLILFAVLSVSVSANAQSSQRTAAAAREWRTGHEAEILQQFTTLLSIPNVASDHENIQRNADLLLSMLQKRGVDSRLLTLEGINPVVFGEIKALTQSTQSSSTRIMMASL